MLKRTIILVLLWSLLACFAGCSGEQADDNAYNFPAALQPFTDGLIEAGINVTFGENPTPVPEGLSPQAKELWPNLPQIPMPAAEAEKLTAVREFFSLSENADHMNLGQGASFEERTIGDVMTLWTSPTRLETGESAVLFIHGGGFVASSRRSQLVLQIGLADALGMMVVAPDYRLAPEHKFPAALDDLVAVYRAMLERFEAEDIGIVGVSSGGSLALSLLLRAKEENLEMPGMLAAISPTADLAMQGDSYATLADSDPMLSAADVTACYAAYRGRVDAFNPLVSPVYGDYEGGPPLFLMTGTRDMTSSDAARIALRARAAGVDVTLIVSDGMWHVPVSAAASVPELQHNYNLLVQFLKAHFGQ